MAHPSSGGGKRKNPLRRLLPFRALYKRYSLLLRRNLRRHEERFRHSTTQNLSAFYRLLFSVKKGFSYLRSHATAAVSFVAPAVFPLLSLLLIVGSLWFFSKYSVGLAVVVGENVIGYVRDSGEYERVNDRVELRVKQESVARTGEELYLLEHFPTLHYAVVPKDDFTRESELFSSLYAMASEYTKYSYGLYLDGELVATAKDRSVLDMVLDKVLSYYAMDPETDNLEILNRVEISRGEYPSEYALGYQRILDLFRTGAPENMGVCTVEYGEDLRDVARRCGVSEPVLRLLNDLPVGEGVYEGIQLVYGKPYLELVVKNTRTVTLTETIPYETEYLYSEDLYEGSRQLLQNGVDGVRQVVYSKVYVNGEESSARAVSYTDVRPAVACRIVLGSKTIAPSGEFIWPLEKGAYYYISSPFGWRWLRGERNFHRGMDIAAAKGVQILAADAGTVTEAGWDKYLGYYVRIDHGNGIETVYGHASKLSETVFAGKKVYQGEVIAYVGSTGNSTGNHLHFAVYVLSSKTYVNPKNYL